MPKTLLYVTGGAAWQQLEAQRNFCAGCGGFFPYTSNVSDTRLGWTVGGGLEVMAWNNWLMRAEYRYADFGTVSLSDGDAFRQAMYDIDLKTHTVTFGVSYLFGGTVIGH